jgi:hypothetical protein
LRLKAARHAHSAVRGPSRLPLKNIVGPPALA